MDLVEWNWAVQRDEDHSHSRLLLRRPELDRPFTTCHRMSAMDLWIDLA
jgi:hypothetical protein